MCRHIERVQAWLENPTFLENSDLVEDLLGLAIEEIVNNVPHSLANQCEKDIQAVIEEIAQAEFLELIISETLKWWQETRQMKRKIFVARCADQVAAGLVFSTLKNNRLREQVGWWQLIERVVRQILVKRMFNRQQMIVDDDLILTYIAIIFDRSEQFTYQGVPAAVSYFTHPSIRRELLAASLESRSIHAELHSELPFPRVTETASQTAVSRRCGNW